MQPFPPDNLPRNQHCPEAVAESASPQLLLQFALTFGVLTGMAVFALAGLASVLGLFLLRAG